MAAKKTFTEQAIIKAYMHYVLNEGKRPNNVYTFAQQNKAEEGDFYKHFSSFEAIEKEIFLAFFTETLKLLKKDEDYSSFETKDKLLSFYFTFFAILTKNRSYVVHALKGNKNKLSTLRMLMPLKEHFAKYIDSLGINTPNIKIPQIEKLKEKGVREVSFNQLLFTLKFWLDDTSSSFEKTDLFIEKSINTGFEIIDSSPLESIIDLGKFLIKEKSSFKM
jgi:hypothetical protein